MNKHIEISFDKVIKRRMKPQNLQSGLTLVELMVSIVLGLIITAAVIQTYLASTQTNRVTQGVNRIQENARFAHHFVTKDLREAGFMGCISSVRNKLNGSADAFNPNQNPVFVWNHKDTESDNTAYALSDATTGVTLSNNASDWDTDIPSFLVGNVESGSDVLWFKSSEKLDIQLSDSNSLNSATLTTTAAHGVESGSILMVGDCTQTEMFQMLSSGGGNQVSLTAPQGGGVGNPGNRNVNPAKWARIHGPDSEVRAVMQTYYYIGEGASGLPSLFRFQTSLSQSLITPAIFSAGTQELVEGVETLQVLLGEDVDNNGKPNTYVSANQVGSWDNVVSSRVGMLLRSPNNVSSDVDQSEDYTLLDNIKFTHASTDKVLRYSINSTVKIRNRGLTSNLSIFVCDAGTCP